MHNDPNPAARTALSFGRSIVVLSALSVIAIIVACGSDAPNDAGPQADASPDGTIPAEGGQGGLDAGEGDARGPGNCVVPEGFDDCANRCGPIRNPCTGVIAKQCGGCPDVGGKKQVCDIEKNTCIAPKLTCLELGAECGRVRNSCGKFLDCPEPGNPDKECSQGDPTSGLSPQECDPDTHKCVTATAVTCGDLGYECGQKWLGVGPKTNTVDCGDCSNFTDRPRCNPILSICEPACTPPTTTDQKRAFCAAAKASRGVQCGIISDGCGGTINCDDYGVKCAGNEECGVRGIANRCAPEEVPLECVAAGRNCGTIKSACDGSDLNCGKCTGTDVCNANGVCGPPCVPKKCADLGSPACLPEPVSDGCNNIVNDCPVCPGGATACKPDTSGDAGVGGSCCVPTWSCTNRPPGINPAACGNALFDNGCGVKLNCGCETGECDNNTKLCCAANACPGEGNVGDSCGNTSLGCGKSCDRKCKKDENGNNNACSGGKCCNPEPDSAGEWRSQNPGRCQFNIPNNCGGYIDAPCESGACIDVQNGPGNEIRDPGGNTLSAMGYCCTNATANCNGTTTCQSIASACITGRTVGCGSGLCANGDDNANDETCFGGVCCDPDACPATRTTGQSCTTGSSYDLKCGKTCQLKCASGNTCVDKGDGLKCCNPEPDDASDWRSGKPAGACGFNISNNCNGYIDAPCGSGLICQNNKVQVKDEGTTFAEGTCCNPADSCGGNPKDVGQACKVGNQCLDGQTVQCPCVGGASCYQDKCCRPNACPGAAQINEPCGDTDLGCGQSCNRRCDTSGGKDNNRCDANSKTCKCVPKTCPVGGTGSIEDGCGHTIPCTGG